MKKLLFVIMSWLVVGAAQAQTAPASAAPSAGALRAAEALFKSMQMDKTLSAGIDQMLEMQLSQNPGLQSVEPEVRTFLNKYMSAAVLKNDIVELYAREFTEPELKQLAAFYQTPTGQKYISKQSSLMQQGMVLGTRRVQEHLPELRASIEKKMQTQKSADEVVK